MQIKEGVVEGFVSLPAGRQVSAFVANKRGRGMRDEGREMRDEGLKTKDEGRRMKDDEP